MDVELPRRAGALGSARSAADEHEFSFCLATIDRPHCVQRLVKSIRMFFPSSPIIVADQSQPTGRMTSFYRQHEVELIQVDYDAGVCFSRNRAVARVQTPYFVLCDDDFIMTPDTLFNGALHILREFEDIAVVGGRILDVYDYGKEGDGEDRHWEKYFFIDGLGGTLVSLPINYLRPSVGYSGPHKFHYCDAVLNFSMMRTSLFEVCGHKWDERFKCNGEHEDFYLSLKMKGESKVAYTPEMVCQHHHPLEPNYRKLRNRDEGWRHFAEKWNIKQYYICGEGLVLLGEGGAVLPNVDQATFFHEKDIDDRFPDGWKSGLVGIGSDGYTYLPGGQRESDEPTLAMLEVEGDGGLSIWVQKPSTRSLAKSKGVLNPTDISVLNNEIRSSLNIGLDDLSERRFLAGETAAILVEIANRSGAIIPMGENPPYRVYISYHWLKDEEYIVWEGERTAPMRDLDERSLHVVLFRCPESPGSYILEVDLLIGDLAWVGVPSRIQIEVGA